MSFDPDKPYNDLPLLPPKVELETKAVLRKAIAANKALAELKGAGKLIPNQGVLINAIVLQEAKLSSEIENVVTTNDELYRASPAGMCSRNKHIVRICPKNPVFWTYPKSMSKTWTYPNGWSRSACSVGSPVLASRIHLARYRYCAIGSWAVLIISKRTKLSGAASNI